MHSDGWWPRTYTGTLVHRPAMTHTLRSDQVLTVFLAESAPRPPSQTKRRSKTSWNDSTSPTSTSLSISGSFPISRTHPNYAHHWFMQVPWISQIPLLPSNALDWIGRSSILAWSILCPDLTFVFYGLVCDTCQVWTDLTFNLPISSFTLSRVS